MKILALFLATSTAGLVMTSATNAEEYWLKEVSKGCEFWSDQPAKEGDVVTWSGECVSGKMSGKGLFLWIRDGGLKTSFDGEMANGKMNGKGILVDKSDSAPGYDVVTGNFLLGEPDGRIMFKSAENQFFVGQFKNGVMAGQGLLVEADGGSFEGSIEKGNADGFGRTISPEGEIYEGQIKDNERHGTGTLILSDRGRYSGEFVNGEMSGFGRFTGPNGNSYVGLFKDSLPDGPGVFVFADGDTYQGIFEMGELNGQVLVTKGDGEQSVETWNKGEPQK